MRLDRPPAAPFSSSHEHLVAELSCVDLLVRMQVERARPGGDESAFRGLTITEDDVTSLLGRPPGHPHWGSAPALPQLAALLEARIAEVRRRVEASAAAGRRLRLELLATRFGLSTLDRTLLLLALAPELDPRYDILYAYLQDDVTRRRPSVNLALALTCGSLEERLLARRRFGPDAPLLRHQILMLFSDAPAMQPTRLAHYFKLDDRIVDFLHEEDALDARIAGLAHGVAAEFDSPRIALPEPLESQLLGLAHRASGAGTLIVYLQGPQGSGKRAVASAIARRAGVGLLEVSGRGLAERALAAPEPLLQLALREARLTGSLPLLSGFDALPGNDQGALRRAVLTQLAAHGGLSFVSGAAPLELPAGVTSPGRFLRVVIPAPSSDERARLWSDALAGSRLAADVDLPALAAREELTAGEIRDAAAIAQGLAGFRAPDAPCVAAADLTDGCRRRRQPEFGALAERITAAPEWNDLVLPEDRLERLGELVDQARHRSKVLETWGFGARLSTGRGLTALFTGAPGTGKTMAAAVLARALGLEVYRIDLASVASKYIGETEKQLAALFASAERAHVVLFFDEADALFGKRTDVKDAHDRYANLETSYLLQRIDDHDGVVILATNYSRNIDEAFTRRMRHVIDFPSPTEPLRRRIWERLLPPLIPGASTIDLALLARRFDLPGGFLRNIAVGAAFLAAAEGSDLAHRHLFRAAKREYQKMGKMIDASLFDAAAMA